MLPYIISHRGVTEYVPENSLSSIFIAVIKGVKCIEVDAMLSKDSIPIIHHDYTLNRSCNIDGNVKDYTYDELSKFDIGGCCSDKRYYNIYKNERIPKLKDVIRLCNRFNIILNIEIKCDNDDLHTPKIICEEIKLYGNHENIIITSFNIKTLKISNEILPNYNKGLIVYSIPFNWYNIIKKTNISYMIFSILESSKTIILEIIKKGKIKLCAYTVDNIKIAKILKDLDISIITNKPYTMNYILYDSNIKTINKDSNYYYEKIL